MANIFVENHLSFDVKIESSKECLDPSNAKYIAYVIHIRASKISWKCYKRYSQFLQFNESLKHFESIDSIKLFPSKFSFRLNETSSEFIEKRLLALDKYLCSFTNELLNALNTHLTSNTTPTIPHDDNNQQILVYSKVFSLLCQFLDFPLYEINFIIMKMSNNFFSNGETIIKENNNSYEFSVLQLFAFNEAFMKNRLKFPYCRSDEDISHSIEMMKLLKNVTIIGSNDRWKESNIIPNDLPFSLLSFTNIDRLQIQNVNIDVISGFEEVKKCLKTFYCHNSIDRIMMLSLNGVRLKDIEMDNEQKNFCTKIKLNGWAQLTTVDLSHNSLENLDYSIKLMCNIESFDLSHNQLENVQYLDLLSSLSRLNLSYNKFVQLPNDLSSKLGNIKTLDLSHNQLRNVNGLGTLYSLVNLSLIDNCLKEFDDIADLGSLPCLETLQLYGNPLQKMIDYRAKILSIFNDRAANIWLDNVQTTTRELDIANIMIAIKNAMQLADNKPIKLNLSGSYNTMNDRCLIKPPNKEFN
ncbi:hypothetical protein SNEBB_009074 [Seison nebaliae]|nr:hypothetical protein SNEBB_009074 [Seison nebaliae]